VKKLFQNHGFLVLIAGLELVLILLAIVGFAQMDWWQTIQLGVIEGVTEFLPISSTAHLLIASDLMQFKHSTGGTFEIFIQLGAIIAVVGFYSRDLLEQARSVVSSPQTRRFWLAIFIAFLPAAVIGVFLHDWIKAVLFSPRVIAWALIIGGIIFIVIERMPQQEKQPTSDLQQISLLQALGIGFAQVLAMIPGTSRSGASIIGGMVAGLDRQTATAFSFYLAMPTLGAATVYDLLKNLAQFDSAGFGWLLLGTVVSLVIAWLSIGWLLRYVATNSFVAFGVYRIVAGGGILVLLAMGWLA
jgi:undecaprenyl-diphosphatase